MEESQEYFEFRKKLKMLKKQHGEGTELISIYIPPGGNVNEVTNRLRDEYGQAMNIKSKQTRKNVQSAIDRVLQTLKGVHKAPDNGISIFCGNINDKIEIYQLIPPQPVQVSTYRCDSAFLLEPLEAMLETKEWYGLLVLDRREATAAIMKGKTVEILRSFTSGVPGKHRKGGQSALRMERLIEIAASEFFKRIADFVNPVFLEKKVKNVIVGGSGPTKYYFVDESYLDNNVKKKIVAIQDTGYTDETGIKELVDRTGEVIKGLEITREKDMVNKFLKEAVTEGLATYGFDEVKQALEKGQVDTLILSEDAKEEIQDELGKIAERTNTKIEMISTETREGTQFLEGFGGIGAFLRYK